MIKVDGTTIFCTRGDNGNTLGDNIVFGYEDVDGNPVSFTVGQKVVVKVFDPKDVSNVFIQKEVEVVPAQLGNTAGVIGASLLIES